MVALASTIIILGIFSKKGLSTEQKRKFPRRRVQQRQNKPRPRFGMKKRDNVTDFLIVSEQRSGSTWMRYTLSSLPRCYMFGEIFINVKKRDIWPKQLQEPERYADLDFIPIEDREKRSLRRIDLDAVGFKAFHSTTKPPTTINHRTNKALFDKTVNYLNAQKGVVIHLERKNLLDRFISQIKSRHIGGGHCELSAKCDQSTLNKLRLNLDITYMLRFLKDATKNAQSVRSMLKLISSQYQIPVLYVDYELLSHDSSKNATTLSEWRRILSHLRMNPEDVNFLKLDRLQKDIQKSYQEIIENFDQVQHALESSNFAHFLRLS
mmetsp:Transcript_2773/g.4367  ORF Transcript_2773/g.4367 Transcript_2773/m.4367 type:complete len:322 (+) Transcript_2773:4070-5035(+)